jgi:molybdopterin adenylyltransferase
MPEVARIAVLTVSDRASAGVYADRSGPAAEEWLRATITTPVEIPARIIPDGANSVAAALCDLADGWAANLIIVSGGTCPAPRDRTPEGMAAVIDFDLPGFGEAMRAASSSEVPTAILSRQGAGVRGRSLIVTLPGSPRHREQLQGAPTIPTPQIKDRKGGERDRDDAVRHVHEVHSCGTTGRRSHHPGRERERSAGGEAHQSCRQDQALAWDFPSTTACGQVLFTAQLAARFAGRAMSGLRLPTKFCPNRRLLDRPRPRSPCRYQA